MAEASMPAVNKIAMGVQAVVELSLPPACAGVAKGSELQKGRSYNLNVLADQVAYSGRIL
jgi:hypothetical protein